MADPLPAYIIDAILDVVQHSVTTTLYAQRLSFAVASLQSWSWLRRLPSSPPAATWSPCGRLEPPDAALSIRTIFIVLFQYSEVHRFGHLIFVLSLMYGRQIGQARQRVWVLPHQYLLSNLLCGCSIDSANLYLP